ncbi:MAG TPA: PAS domain S-box protein, partial [Rubrobacteraceae bacterium]|nr:PAS domain S-box protein [Rubrobacteraceae bacterium]
LLVLRELKRGGYEPKYERVETPEAMKEALTNSEWDVVISDYHLPRFGGLEALKMWRETVSEAPFIVVSGKVGEDVAVEMMKTGAYDYVMKDNLGRLCATVKRGLEEARERRVRKRVERELRRRDAILEAVRFAAERLLGEAVGWEESVRAILRRLGEATETSRVYIFENFVGEDGEVWATMRHEWVARGVSVQMDNPLMEAMPYRAAGYGRWVEVLSRGEPVYGHTREFPGSEQPELRNQDILSIVVVPIFVEGRWWGFIGFDECVREREWSTAEIGALGAAAGTLGAAIRRRRIEEELRQSEERYRAVIEQATDGIYLLDVDTKRLLETNPSLQKILRYTADELRGMEVYDFVAHPRENIDSVIQRALSERRRFVGERKYRRKNGSLVDVEVGVSVILLGDKEVICTIVRDITERKRAEEALARSEYRLRTIIETEPECVKVLGMDGSLLEMNPAGLSMIEADSLEQVRGKTVYEYIAPEHRADFVALTERVLRGGSGTLEFEFVGLKGTSRWLETHAVPLRDARGEITGLLAITRDITERKKNEEALRESEERFKGLAEASFEGIAITQDGKIIETNAAFATMFGYEPSEVIGMTPLDVTAPESREVVRNSRSSGFEEPYEAVSLRKDGTTFDTEIRGKMSSYKGQSVRVSAIRD